MSSFPIQSTLPKVGALIVYEAIIDDERRQNTFGSLMSLNMLIQTQAGFDFTGAGQTNPSTLSLINAALLSQFCRPPDVSF
jgi:hypothetical protein